MALTKQALKREFIIENRGGNVSLPDPNPAMTPDQVMVFYSTNYPELATSTVHGPVYQGDRMKYTFKTTVGTKG